MDVNILYAGIAVFVGIVALAAAFVAGDLATGHLLKRVEKMMEGS